MPATKEARPLDYLDPRTVTDKRRGEAPRNPYPSGYGRKIPTSWELRVGTRWRRVYVMQWSNAGSAYIIQHGKEVFLGSFEP